jgi:hypothetical protein
MCDGTIDGRPIHLNRNLKLVAACNPYRKYKRVICASEFISIDSCNLASPLIALNSIHCDIYDVSDILTIWLLDWRKLVWDIMSVQMIQLIDWVINYDDKINFDCGKMLPNIRYLVLNGGKNVVVGHNTRKCL